jgi:recombination protein RecA
MILIPGHVKCEAAKGEMQTERLQRAVGAIHVRFGDQILVRGNRLPAAQSWPTGQSGVDRVCGIGGLPLGRVSVLRGMPGSGKLSLALALLARATREFARAVAIDLRSGFDPWTLEQFGAELGALILVRPPTPALVGEAAVTLARAGAGFLLVLGPLPEPALAPLESAAARSGCLVVAVADVTGAADAADAHSALAFASSLTLELKRLRWLKERRQVVGLRSRMSCTKNKLAAPGGEAELEVRYRLGPRLGSGELLREGQGGGHVVELWQGWSAAG